MTKPRIFVINSPQIRSRAAEAVMAIKGQDNIEVIIQEHKDDQTAEQRGWFHVLVKILAEEFGYSQNAMKQAIKEEAWGSEEVEVLGKTQVVIKSSAGAKKDEYSELIETAYRIGSEYGVILPNPRWNG